MMMLRLESPSWQCEEPRTYFQIMRDHTINEVRACFEAGLEAPFRYHPAAADWTLSVHDPKGRATYTFGFQGVLRIVTEWLQRILDTDYRLRKGTHRPTFFPTHALAGTHR